MSRKLVRRLSLVAACGLLVLACKRDDRGLAIDLLVPDGTGRTVPMTPRSAYAEYVEIEGSFNELRLTLATHEVSCERYVAPGPDDTVIVVTLRLPPNEKPRPGSFTSTPPPPPDDAGAPPTRAHAQSVLRRGSRAHVLLPGGTLELRQVDLAPMGAVAGSLAFEYPGDGVHPASAIKGKFSARICRSDPEPGTR